MEKYSLYNVKRYKDSVRLIVLINNETNSIYLSKKYEDREIRVEDIVEISPSMCKIGRHMCFIIEPEILLRLIGAEICMYESEIQYIHTLLEESRTEPLVHIYEDDEYDVYMRRINDERSVSISYVGIYDKNSESIFTGEITITVGLADCVSRGYFTIEYLGGKPYLSSQRWRGVPLREVKGEDAHIAICEDMESRLSKLSSAMLEEKSGKFLELERLKNLREILQIYATKTILM